ncbi:hypothetical protein [Picrophilus oshimae]|nr:hypothetical protein [Picrophilus oshimae]
MSLERFYYYMRLINSTPYDMKRAIELCLSISQALENDNNLTDSEKEDLEKQIGERISFYNRYSLKVINALTGIEEEPPKTVIDDFGGSALFIGKEIKYGIEWKVYISRSLNTKSQKWYYNERVAEILNKALRNAVPNKMSNYFDIPPWMLGPYYKSLGEIINIAIEKEIIPNAEFLVSRGLPREFIYDIRENNPKL